MWQAYEAHSITQRYLLHDKALQDFPVYQLNLTSLIPRTLQA